MFPIFHEEPIITFLMFAFLTASILLRVLLAAIYQRMIKETDNMATTENRLLKQCKAKFGHCYQLNNGVPNIPIFVDKFINRMAVGPFSFVTLYHLSGQVMMLSVVTAGMGICKSIMDGKMLGEILPFYIASFFGLYLYFSVSGVVDIKGKRRILKVNLVDYLENHLSARIHVTEQDMNMLYGKRTVELMPIGGRIAVGGESQRRRRAIGLEERRFPEPVEIGRKAGTPERKLRVAEQAADDARVTAEELDVLLQEFLTV